MFFCVMSNWMYADVRLTHSYLSPVSSGGRGMDGNPIIVLPEFPAFGELEEEELKSVLGYLTSVPGLASLSLFLSLSHSHTHEQAPPFFGSFLFIVCLATNKLWRGQLVGLQYHGMPADVSSTQKAHH